MKKHSYPLHSIMLIDSNAAELSKAKKALREMGITNDLVSYNSVKEAFESLLLLKSFDILKNKKYPELILLDAGSEYYPRRNFLSELLLLFPEKKNRPDIILLWKNKLPPKHVLARGWIEKPLNKEKLYAAIGHFVKV